MKHRDDRDRRELNWRGGDFSAVIINRIGKRGEKEGRREIGKERERENERRGPKEDVDSARSGPEDVSGISRT